MPVTQGRSTNADDAEERGQGPALLLKTHARSHARTHARTQTCASRRQSSPVADAPRRTGLNEGRASLTEAFDRDPRRLEGAYLTLRPGKVAL